MKKKMLLIVHHQQEIRYYTIWPTHEEFELLKEAREWALNSRTNTDKNFKAMLTVLAKVGNNIDPETLGNIDPNWKHLQMSEHEASANMGWTRVYIIGEKQVFALPK